MYLCIVCHDRKYPHCSCGKSFICVKRCRCCRKEGACADCADCRPKPKTVYFVTKDYSFLGVLNTPFLHIKANYQYMDGEFWLELDAGKYCEGKLVLKNYPRLYVPTNVRGMVRELH